MEPNITLERTTPTNKLSVARWLGTAALAVTAEIPIVAAVWEICQNGIHFPSPIDIP